MSQAFLNRLLSTTENRVRSNQDANCMICLEDFNTLNTSTGVVEWEVALPCGHRVGSSCIVTWLQTNNNCPACRATFFHKQPRPYLENGIIMNTGSARMAMIQAPTPQVVPSRTARTPLVPATTRRLVSKETMTWLEDCTTCFGILVFAIGMGMYIATYLPDVQLCILRFNYLIAAKWFEFWSRFTHGSGSSETMYGVVGLYHLYGPME